MTFQRADILLPKFSKDSDAMKKWSVVACDQYTSQPEYWQAVEQNVGDAPSALRLILPECYLKETEERVPKLHKTMEEYVRDLLLVHRNKLLYVERVQSDGRVRRGLVGMVDL